MEKPIRDTQNSIEYNLKYVTVARHHQTKSIWKGKSKIFKFKDLQTWVGMNLHIFKAKEIQNPVKWIEAGWVKFAVFYY